MANTAHIYKAKSGNWNMSFHHPLCREGSIGKKIHRSLKVSDDSQARNLEKQINELLAIADETPSLLSTRSIAIAEQKYARVVIDAFFDCITPEPVDYLSLREHAMPMPPRFKKKRPVPRVLLLGATGVGKSRLIQHLLQTTRENFPMRGAGRTTVSDTEIIVDDIDFSAVVTFFSENEIRQIVRENILEACSFAYKEKEDKAKVASKLLIDSDKRFRFNFVLGGWAHPIETNVDDDDDLELDDHDLEFDTHATRVTTPWAKLEHCVDQVLSMAAAAWEKARTELRPASEQDELVVDEYWLQFIDPDQLDALTEEILEELEKRLCEATGESSWPAIHRLVDTPDKAEFFRRLRPFYQNNRALFGALVTPLVQGIRVRGRFAPPPWAAAPSSAWVLLDGQGVDHEQGASTRINRTVPPELTRKYSGADVICLVDRSVPSMTGDSPILLEDLIVRGYLDRLALVFTHFESVAAPDLDGPGRRAKVLEGLSNAIQHIDSLPKAQKVLLERTADSRAYFLSRLDSQDLKHRPTQTEIKRICDRFNSSIGEAPVLRVRPLFNEYQIASVLRREIESYRHDWSETELSSYHWKIMEALTNWIGNAYSDGYPKRSLYPGQDLSRRLVSAVSTELENPKSWTPDRPESPEQESQILNAIRNKVGDRIDAYCRETVVQDPRTGSWLPAYENIFGRGTKVRRARRIARILEDQAQLPDEGLGKFTKDIWAIVEETIAQVCSASTEQRIESIAAS